MAAHLGKRDTEMVCHPAQANTVPPSLIGYGDGRVHDAGGQAVGRAGFLLLLGRCVRLPSSVHWCHHTTKRPPAPGYRAAAWLKGRTMMWGQVRAIIVLPGTVLVFLPAVILWISGGTSAEASVAGPDEVVLWLATVAATVGLWLAV